MLIYFLNYLDEVAWRLPNPLVYQITVERTWRLLDKLLLTLVTYPTSDFTDYTINSNSTNSLTRIHHLPIIPILIDPPCYSPYGNGMAVWCAGEKAFWVWIECAINFFSLNGFSVSTISCGFRLKVRTFLGHRIMPLFPYEWSEDGNGEYRFRRSVFLVAKAARECRAPQRRTCRCHRTNGKANGKKVNSRY